MEQITRDWNKLYDLYIKSGLSQNAFAKKYSIPESTLHTRFSKMKSAQKTVSKQTNKEDPAPFSFVSVIPEPSEKAVNKADMSSLKLNIGKFSIGIEKNFDKALLTDVLKVLTEIC